MTPRTPFIRLFPVEKYYKNVPFAWFPTTLSQFRSGVARDALTTSEKSGENAHGPSVVNAGQIDGSKGQPRSSRHEYGSEECGFRPRASPQPFDRSGAAFDRGKDRMPDSF